MWETIFSIKFVFYLLLCSQFHRLCVWKKQKEAVRGGGGGNKKKLVEQNNSKNRHPCNETTYHRIDRHTHCSVWLVVFGLREFLNFPKANEPKTYTFKSRIWRKNSNNHRWAIFRQSGNYISLCILFDFFNYLITASLWFWPKCGRSSKGAR